MVVRVLDLCCGSRSVDKALRSLLGEGNYEYVGLDNDPESGADIKCNVLEWDYYNKYPVGHFDIVWASPPCTEYSCAKSVGKRNFELADAIVTRCIDIQRFFQPRWWFLENPGTGFLSHREFMQPMRPFINKCTYCKYGTPYKKLTYIWTNRQGLKLHNCNVDPCDYKREHGLHYACAQGGSHRLPFKQHCRRDTTYQVPEGLIHSLFEGI